MFWSPQTQLEIILSSPLKYAVVSRTQKLRCRTYDHWLGSLVALLHHHLLDLPTRKLDHKTVAWVCYHTYIRIVSMVAYGWLVQMQHFSNILFCDLADTAEYPDYWGLNSPKKEKSFFVTLCGWGNSTERWVNTFSSASGSVWVLHYLGTGG